MGVGYFEQRMTPDFVVKNDLEFIAMTAKYSQPQEQQEIK